MKTFSPGFRIATAGCALAMTMAMPSRIMADVSDEEFKALKEMVNKLAQKVQTLEQTHATASKTHQKAVEEIQQLKKVVGETQSTAANAEAKADAATQIQPIHPIP